MTDIECSCSRLASLKFSFALILAGTISLLSDVRYVTVNEKLFIVTFNKHYRTKCQLVLCVLGSYILAQVTGQFIVHLKLYSDGNCPLDWNSNPMVYVNPLLKKHSILYE